jgi:uncharacterized protein YdgA (DUF945 family)
MRPARPSIVLVVIAIGAALLGACWVTAGEVRDKIAEGDIDSAVDTAEPPAE